MAVYARDTYGEGSIWSGWRTLVEDGRFKFDGCWYTQPGGRKGERLFVSRSNFSDGLVVRRGKPGTLRVAAHLKRKLR